MAKIVPFSAIRPTRDKVSLVASRSYLSYSKETLTEKLKNNPYTFLHIINPDFSVGKEVKDHNEKFKLVKEKFYRFTKDGIFKKDQNLAMRKIDSLAFFVSQSHVLGICTPLILV